MKRKNNIYELDLVSFEYVLLSFSLLIDWIYAENDDFRIKRNEYIKIRNKLISAVDKEEDYKEIPEIVQWIKNIGEYNIERLSSKLLFELTRNTGFEVGKGELGNCWRVDCCNVKKDGNDLCGLDEKRITLEEKMKAILENSLLKNEFWNIERKFL